MKGLTRSSSASGLAPAVALGLAPGASAVVPLLEGTLYVSKSCDAKEAPAWEPYRFAHHTDGSLSFRPLRGNIQKAGGKLGAIDSRLSSLQSRGQHEEFFLDADWRQPFLAAPWKPLARSNDGSKLQLPDEKPTSGGEFFPFTLSYAPSRPKPGDVDLTTGRRRTVVLAAPTARAREKWLAALARKAHSPQLRNGASVCPPGSSSGPSGRQVAALGEEHIGLHLRSGRDSSVPRLSTGPPSLFDTHSSLRIVRDLYDGYAADPLLHNGKGQYLQRPSSDSDSSGVGPPSASGTRKSKFLERYLDRQAEIESLLDQKWSGPSNDAALPSSEDQRKECTPSSGSKSLAAVHPRSCEGHVHPVRGTADDSQSLIPQKLKLLDKTVNTSLQHDILSNVQWSGGAIFDPPDERSFRLTICPIDPLEDYPVFMGICPSEADLSQISLFSSCGGVFLCAGGRASDDLISALGAPGGPAFFTLGQRSFARLPAVKPGHSISLHYWEDEKGGQLRFFITSAEGEEIKSDRPPLEEPLPTGGWRPCLLLSMPGTRVHVVRLI